MAACFRKQLPRLSWSSEISEQTNVIEELGQHARVKLMDNYAACDPTTIATMKAYVEIFDGNLNLIHKHKHKNAHSEAQTKAHKQSHKHTNTNLSARVRN